MNVLRSLYVSSIMSRVVDQAFTGNFNPEGERIIVYFDLNSHEELRILQNVYLEKSNPDFKSFFRELSHYPVDHGEE